MPGYVEKNLDTVEALAVKPETTLVFLGPPRYASIFDLGFNDLINFSSITSLVSGLMNGSLNINLGPIKLLGAVMSFSYSIQNNILPIKPLGAKTRVFETGDTTQGSLMLSTLVIPDNIISKIISQKPDNVIANALSTIVNTKGRVQYDLSNTRHPFGLILIEMNKGYATPLGIHYFEMCKVVSISKSIQAGNPIVIDNLSVVFHRVKEIIT